MTRFVGGIIDLGNAQPLEHFAKRLATAMPGALDGTLHCSVHGPAALVQVCTCTGRRKKSRVLETPSHLFAGNLDLVHSDGRSEMSAESILSALSDDPFDGVRTLDGEFAFAIWNKPRRSLTLIRDRGGTRPLFYVHKPSQWFAFASLPWPLIQGGLAARDFDLPTLAQWSLSFDSHGDQTHFREVKRVLPAHSLTLDGATAVQRRYWSLRNVPKLPSDADYGSVTAELHDRIEKAVHRRLPAAGRAFSHMSGGLDSAPLAVFAARKLAARGDRVTAYSFLPRLEYERDPDLPIVTERPAIEALCGQNPNIDLVAITNEPNPVVTRSYFSSECPGVDDASFPYNQVLTHASATGASTILSGFGGDEAASYDGRAAAAELMRRWRFWPYYKFVRKRPQNLFGLASLALGFAKAHPGVPPLRWLAGLRSPAARDWMSMLAYLLPSFRTRTVGPSLAPDCQENIHQRFSGGRLGILCEELAWRAARHSIAYSFPLMDRAVVEFAASIPAELHVRRRIRRSVYRDAMAGVLPDEILLRETKMLANPRGLYRMADQKPALQKEIAALRGTQAARLFDLDAIAHDVDAIPAEAEFIADVRREAARDLQYRPKGLQVLWPLHLACYLAAAEDQDPSASTTRTDDTPPAP